MQVESVALATRALLAANPKDAVALREQVLANGAIVRPIGQSSLTFCPPLVMTDDEVDRASHLVETARHVTTDGVRETHARPQVQLLVKVLQLIPGVARAHDDKENVLAPQLVDDMMRRTEPEVWP